MTWLAFLILMCHSALALDLDPRRVESIAGSKAWLRLLHFKPVFPFGSQKSQVDGADFFFSPQGSRDGRAELLASADAFGKAIEVGKLKQHPQCAFPARYRFLKEKLKLPYPDVACPKFEEYLARFNHPQSVTLVFSSAYPNNPGSMFGHTFLRINARGSEKEKKIDILDYGISYAARVGDDVNGLVFAMLGIGGGFMGQFSMLPYYVKVNEYSYSESRDLWEYDLNLSPEETKTLLAHAWELETNTYFRYYFFDENCAYVLLTLIEVAKPDWELSDFFYVIPGETIKKVMNTPGAVREVHFRPSLRKKMLQRFEALSVPQRREFFDLIAGRAPVKDIQEAPPLEAATSYLYYTRKRDGESARPEHQEFLRAILAQRSQIREPSSEPAELPPIDEGTRPDLGHHTTRLGSSGGVQAPQGRPSRYFQELQYKFAFHDLMNDDTGYTPFSQIDFPEVVFRYLPETGMLNLERLGAVRIVSLMPLSFLEKRWSWAFNLDYYSPKDYGCLTCHLARFYGGGGVTVALGSPKLLLYGLGLIDVEGGESLRKGYRLGPKIETAILANPVRRYKTAVTASLQADLLQDDRQKLFFQPAWEQSFAFSQAWEIRSSLSWVLPTTDSRNLYREGKLTLNYYF